MYQKYIEDLREKKLSNSSLSRFASIQLLELYEEVKRRTNPLIVELGVDKGLSTRVFLNAINEKKDSKLISIDIADCSQVCKSKKWKFIQSNSLDIEKILIKCPEIISKGIDILYIDSLHIVEHVEKEFYLYFPYMNKNSTIFFDDVDSQPYMINQRKDSISMEIGNRKISDFIESVFLSNLNNLNLTFYKGSTGLARLEKLSDKGDLILSPNKKIERKNKLLWKLIYFLLGKKEYRPNSELPFVDLTKYK